MSETQSQHTLLSIIEQLQQAPTRKKSTDSEKSKTRWTREDEKLIFELLIKYGEDLSLIQSYFVNMSRKQVKRKVKQILQKRKSIFEKLQQRAQRERRKSFFDEQILEEDQKCNI